MMAVVLGHIVMTIMVAIVTVRGEKAAGGIGMACLPLGAGLAKFPRRKVAD